MFDGCIFYICQEISGSGSNQHIVGGNKRHSVTAHSVGSSGLSSYIGARSSTSHSRIPSNAVLRGRDLQAVNVAEAAAAARLTSLILQHGGVVITSLTVETVRATGISNPEFPVLAIGNARSAFNFLQNASRDARLRADSRSGSMSRSGSANFRRLSSTSSIGGGSVVSEAQKRPQSPEFGVLFLRDMFVFMCVASRKLLPYAEFLVGEAFLPPVLGALPLSRTSSALAKAASSSNPNSEERHSPGPRVEAAAAVRGQPVNVYGQDQASRQLEFSLERPAGSPLHRDNTAPRVEETPPRDNQQATSSPSPRREIGFEEEEEQHSPGPSPIDPNKPYRTQGDTLMSSPPSAPNPAESHAEGSEEDPQAAAVPEELELVACFVRCAEGQLLEVQQVLEDAKREARDERDGGDDASSPSPRTALREMIPEEKRLALMEAVEKLSESVDAVIEEFGPALRRHASLMKTRAELDLDNMTYDDGTGQKETLTSDLQLSVPKLRQQKMRINEVASVLQGSLEPPTGRSPSEQAPVVDTEELVDEHIPRDPQHSSSAAQRGDAQMPGGLRHPTNHPDEFGMCNPGDLNLLLHNMKATTAPPV